MALKYMAAAFMAVDHVGMLFDPLSAFFTAGDPARQLLRYLGRLAFPIFAFFVAEGCRKTRNYPAYLRRLGLFALLAQFPLLLLPSLKGCGNVLTTFFLAALGIFFWREGQVRGWKARGWLAMGACVLAVEVLRGDYGWVGAFLVCAVYLTGEDRRRQLLVLGGGLAFYYLLSPLWIHGCFLALEALGGTGGGAFFAGLTGEFPLGIPFSLPFCLLTAGFALLSLPLLARYNGERGRGGKWFFYWFYPGHLALLGLVKILITQW